MNMNCLNVSSKIPPKLPKNAPKVTFFVPLNRLPVADGVECDSVGWDALVQVEERVGRQHQGAADRLGDGQAPEGRSLDGHHSSTGTIRTIIVPQVNLAPQQ